MDQLDFEAQAKTGECPVCKAQQQDEKTLELRRVREVDEGKKL